MSDNRRLAADFYAFAALITPGVHEFRFPTKRAAKRFFRDFKAALKRLPVGIAPTPSLAPGAREESKPTLYSSVAPATQEGQ